MGRSSENRWVRVAHGLLRHGELLRTRELRHDDLWPLCLDASGRGISKSTGSDIVAAMVRRGGYFAHRPLRFGPGMGYVVGVAMGTESMRAALVDANGRLLAAGGAPYADLGDGDDAGWHIAELPPMPGQIDADPATVLGRIGTVAARVLRRAAADEALLRDGRLPLLGVAVAWPSPMDRVDMVPSPGALTHPQWRLGTLGLHRRLARHLGLPDERVHAINDGNAVALAAAFDRIRSFPEASFDARRRHPGRDPVGFSLIAIRLGGGLGAGTVIAGAVRTQAPRSAFLETRLVAGAGGLAGELGHLPVTAIDLEELHRNPEDGLAPMPAPATHCRCGRREDACLQAYASVTAFVARMEASGIAIPGIPPPGERTLASVMHEAMGNVRDQRQLRAQRDIGRLVGRFLAAPALLLNPSEVVLSGSLAVEGVLDGIRIEKNRWWPPNWAAKPHLRLLEGRVNRYAAARGAALAAFRGVLYRRFETLDTPGHPLSRLAMPVDDGTTAGWDVTPS